MLGGALSGGVMAGGSVAINAYQNGRLFKEGLKAPEGSEIRKAAEQIRAELTAGQKVSQAEYEKLGQLMDANTQFRDILNTELNEQNPAQNEQITAQNEQKNSAAEAETGSTVINTNPAQHTPAEQKVIDEYQAAVDENLVNFVETSMENKGSNKGKYTLKPVSERASADIKNLTGIDTTGYKTVLEQRMAEHIVDRHGADGAANKFMQDFNDIGRMQYILDNYDRMELAGNTRAYTTNKYNGMPGQAKTVKYIKAVNGTYYVIEAVPDTKAKTAFIVSAYMSGNTKTGNLQTADANAPAYTAKTENAAIPATQTIPQTSANSQEGNAVVLPESSVGAATRGFVDNPNPGERVPSQNKSVTTNPFLTEDEKAEYNPAHERISTAEQNRRADNMFVSYDDAGAIRNWDEVAADLMSKDAWTAEEQKAAQKIFEQYRKEARVTGDYEKLNAFAKAMADIGRSEAGRSLQARQEFSHDGDGENKRTGKAGAEQQRSTENFS